MLPEWEGHRPGARGRARRTRCAPASRPIPRGGPRRPASSSSACARDGARRFPRACLTFCVTDIEDAGALWDRSPAEMARAVVELQRGGRVDRRTARRALRHVDVRRDGVGVPVTGRRGRSRAQPRRADSPTTAGRRHPIPRAHRTEHRRGERPRRRLLRTGAARRDAGPRPRVRRRGARVAARPPTSCARIFPRAPTLVDVGDDVFALASDADRVTARRAPCARIRDWSRSARRTPTRFVGREALVARSHRAPRHRAASSRSSGASGSGKSSLLRAGLAPLVPDATVITPGAHPMRRLLELRARRAADHRPVRRDLHGVQRCRRAHHVHRSAAQATRAGDARHPRRLLHPLRRASRPRGRGRGAPRAPRADDRRRAPARHRRARRAGRASARSRAGRRDRRGGVGRGRRPPAARARAARATWDARNGRALTLDAYRRTGGVHGAIARTADTDLRRVRSRRSGARRGSCSSGSSSPATEPKTPAAGRACTSSSRQSGHPGRLHTVLNALTEARLVTVDAGTIELAHEALIREWPRLRRVARREPGEHARFART